VALRWIDEARVGSLSHVTITHLIGAAVARAIAAEPAVNAIVRRGQIWHRRSVDVFFQVARDDGQDLLGAKIEHADEKSPLQIARELERQVAKIRGHRAGALDHSGTMLGMLPARLVRPLMRLIEMLTYDFGFDLRAVDIPYDAFGSVMVTNVGSFGLPNALVPLVPFSRTPILVSVGSIRMAPVVSGHEVVVRPVLSLGVTLDHRVLDGAQAGRLAMRLLAILREPSTTFGDPRAAHGDAFMTNA
jgi:pyruvate dehydrogenase E2 component (dihydrolipoamide acetyltransferase)